MLSGTSQRGAPGGLTLTCSRLAVSGVTSTLRSLKLGPYCVCMMRQQQQQWQRLTCSSRAGLRGL